jgi:hypothetical protein
MDLQERKNLKMWDRFIWLREGTSGVFFLKH